MAEYHYDYQYDPPPGAPRQPGPPSGGGRRNDDSDFASWIPVLIFLFCFPPVGVVLLVLKLMGVLGNGKKRGSASRHPYDMQWEGSVSQAQSQTAQAPGAAARGGQYYVRREQSAPGGSAKKRNKKMVRRPDSDPGRGLTIGGGIMAALFGFLACTVAIDAIATASLLEDLAGLFMMLGFCGVGLFMVYQGATKTRRSKRYRKYLALIGKRDSISVTTLAQAMGVSVHKACDDLQDMLDDGIFPTGYLDMSTGRLVLNGEGIQDLEPEAEAPKEEDAPKGMEREEQVLTEIRQVNDAIADPTMSAKIDRVGEITGKIFAYLREKPDKEGQLRSFLSYYLPTTLKILRAYAQMEAQGIEGENISAAKKRIENMMDKVVDGFEKQLDKLFQDDAMDITTDVEVLERMLDKDGLGGQGMTLGGT